MHVGHIDIDAELGGAGRLGDGIDPLGLLADVLELGRRLQWRVSLNAQCLRGLDKRGIGVAFVTVQDKTIVGAQRRSRCAQICCGCLKNEPAGVGTHLA